MTSYLTSSFIESLLIGYDISAEQIENIDDREFAMYLKSFDSDLIQYAIKNYVLNLGEVQLFIFMKKTWKIETIIKKPTLVKLFNMLMELADESTVMKCMIRTEKMKNCEIIMEAKNKKTAQRFISQLSNRDR